MKTLIAGNWKMNKTISEAQSFVNEYKTKINVHSNTELLLCVPFTCLHVVSEACKGSNIFVGAQDLFFEESGAFTGAISPKMLLDAGASFVLIGHSERRMIFAETNEDINKKLKIAIKHGLKPVLCVGETLEERESGELFSVLETQLKSAFADISNTDVRQVVVAYEPIWAIGTGKTASSKDADDAHIKVREILTKIYDKDFSDTVRILYGGSVNVNTYAETLSMPNINGVLVGGSSLDPENFAKISDYV